MVSRWASALTAIGIAGVGGTSAVPSIDIAAAEASWRPQFVLTGTKTEPTYVEHIRLERAGDVFVLQGGAPAGMASSRESVALRADGRLVHLECPTGMRCDGTETPSGFLASAAILAAIRDRHLSGSFPLLPYGDLQLVCIPAELLGIRDPVLDPLHRGTQRRGDRAAPPPVRRIRWAKPGSLVDHAIDLPGPTHVIHPILLNVSARKDLHA
jgi:hypothetical protein